MRVSIQEVSANSGSKQIPEALIICLIRKSIAKKQFLCSPFLLARQDAGILACSLLNAAR